jgi:hypothetical protein
MERKKKLTSYSWGKEIHSKYRCGKIPCPDFVRFQKGPKQKFVVKELYVRDVSLKYYGLSNWIWIRLNIKQNHWSILKKKKKRFILYQFRADVKHTALIHSSQWCSRDWHVHSTHVNSFSYLLWHTWRVICLEGWTQNLTSVCSVVKLTSTWSTSPGPNSSTFMRHMVQCMAMAGKRRGFITSISRKECVKIIVCLLLSTIA